MAAIEDAVEAIAKMDRGTVVSHFVMSNLLRIPYDPKEKKYYDAVSEVNTLLADRHNIFLGSRVNKGYEIKARGLEFQVIEREFARESRAISKTSIKSTKIDVDGISDNELRNKTIDIVSKVQTANLFLRKSGAIKPVIEAGTTENESIAAPQESLPAERNADAIILDMKRRCHLDIEIAQTLERKTGIPWDVAAVVARYNTLKNEELYERKA
jgi:hypothetical protein